jgi:hypothetical protein
VYGPRPIHPDWFWGLPREDQLMYLAYDNTLHAPAELPAKGDKHARLKRDLATYNAKVAAGAG